MPRDAQPTARHSGFTLIELLLTISILGVLATIVVFAVRGISDDGTAAAAATDERILATAQETHMAQKGTYASEAELVSAGMLRDESDLYDVALGPDGGYTLTYVGGGSGSGSGSGSGPTTTLAQNTAVPITFAGMPAESYGSGGPTFVFVNTGDSWNLESDFDSWVASMPVDNGITVIEASLQDAIYGDGLTHGQVASNLALSGATWIGVGGGNEAGQLSNALGTVGATNWMWSHNQPGSAIIDVVAYYQRWVTGSDGGTPITVAGRPALRKGPEGASTVLRLVPIGSGATMIQQAFFDLDPTTDIPPGWAFEIVGVGFPYDGAVGISSETVDGFYTAGDPTHLLTTADVSVSTSYGSEPIFEYDMWPTIWLDPTGPGPVGGFGDIGDEVS